MENIVQLVQGRQTLESGRRNSNVWTPCWVPNLFAKNHIKATEKKTKNFACYTFSFRQKCFWG